MEILIAYDVATDTPEGKRRLRRVAKVCESRCQRVQKSVFECVLNDQQLEHLRHRLRSAMAEQEDSLRIYRLREPRGLTLEVYGKQPEFDVLRDSLVL